MKDESNGASTSSVTEMLSLLQAHGVRSATFNSSGALCHVEFFAPMLPLEPESTPEGDVAKEQVGALERLAARQSRQRDEES